MLIFGKIYLYLLSHDSNFFFFFDKCSSTAFKNNGSYNIKAFLKKKKIIFCRRLRILRVKHFYHEKATLEKITKLTLNWKFQRLRMRTKIHQNGGVRSQFVIHYGKLLSILYHCEGILSTVLYQMTTEIKYLYFLIIIVLSLKTYLSMSLSVIKHSLNHLQLQNFQKKKRRKK